LLRCARNDDKPNPPPSSRTSEARCGTHNHRASFARKSSNSISQHKRHGVWVPASAGTTPMANAPRPRTRVNTTDHSPSLRAQPSNPASSRMRMDRVAPLAMTTNQIHPRRPAQAKRDAGPITTGLSLRGSHRTASLKTTGPAYPSPRSQRRHDVTARRGPARLPICRGGIFGSRHRSASAMRANRK
jgi:hypothetical protein